jgi:hypothetical protein
MEPQSPNFHIESAVSRLIEYHCIDIEPVEGEIRFDVKVESGVDLDLQFVVLRPEIRMRINERPEELCSLKIEVVYRYTGLKDFIVDGALILPENVWTLLINIALGTARGMLASKNAGLSYGNTLMPPIETKNLLPAPLVLTQPEGAKRTYIKAS